MCNKCNNKLCSNPCQMCQELFTPCGCENKCTTPCPPPVCTDGCDDIVKTDCIQLSKDLDFCGTLLEKDSTLTDALEEVLLGVCNGIVVTNADVNVEVSATDRTSGFLFDKLTACDNISLTKTNPTGNEKVNICLNI